MLEFGQNSRAPRLIMVTATSGGVSLAGGLELANPKTALEPTAKNGEWALFCAELSREALKGWERVVSS